jgi:hypothetical protein
MTLEQVANHCITNGLRLADATKTLANKVLYDRTWGNDPNVPSSEFMEISCPEAADTAQNSMPSILLMGTRLFQTGAPVLPT